MELMPARANERLTGIDCVLNEFRNLHDRLLENDFSTHHPRDIEQIINQADQVTRRALDDGPRPLELLLSRRVSTQDLSGIADRRQRIAQLVSEHRQEFILAVIDVLERLLSFPALGHIEADSHNHLIIDTAGAGMYPEHTAGRMAVAVFNLGSSRRVALI